MTTTKTKQVPSAACQFRFAELQFSEADPEAKTFPFRMQARSGGVIEHWYWGRIVHDMKGMQLRKDVCPVDYNHCSDDIIGYADKFRADAAGLQAEGELVALALAPEDKAFEVYQKGKAGIPYEASIDWRGKGIVIEELGEGATAEVNGQTVTGPACIVRKWPLRSIAVTPYGADSDTRTEFSEAGSDGAEHVSVCLFSSVGEKNVTKPNEPAADPSRQLSEPPTATGVSLDTIKQFNDAFGAKAGEYLAAGLTFSDAKLKFTEDRLATLDAENKQLKEASETAKTQQHSAEAASKLLGEGSPIETGKATGGKAKKFADLVRLPQRAAV